MTKKKKIILAIDVSSTQLEAHISDGQSILLRKAFNNNKSGCSQLFKIAQNHNVTRCALEATGGYEQAIKVAIVAVMRKMIIEANKNLKFYYKNVQKNY